MIKKLVNNIFLKKINLKIQKKNIMKKLFSGVKIFQMYFFLYAYAYFEKQIS